MLLIKTNHKPAISGNPKEVTRVSKLTIDLMGEEEDWSSIKIDPSKYIIVLIISSISLNKIIKIINSYLNVMKD